MSVPRSAQVDCRIEHSEQVDDTNEAWRFLSNYAKQLDGTSNVAQEDLMLNMF